MPHPLPERRVGMRCAGAFVLLGLGTGAFANVDELNNLPAGHWYEFPNSRLDQVDPEDDPAVNPNHPAEAPWHGNEGVKAVFDDWCGAAYNYAEDSLIAWCGGHQGYAGNEVYAFDVVNGTWSRAREPYGSIGNPDARPADDWCIFDGSLNPDGSPCSNHTYDYVDYHFLSNSLVALGNSGGYPGFRPNESAGSRNAHLFDFDTGTWSVGDERPTGGGMTGSSSAYDPNRDVFWLLPARDRPLAMYDPNADQWTEYRAFNIDIDAVSAIDPVRDLFVSLDERGNAANPGGRVIVHDLGDPNAGGTTVTTVGATELEDQGQSPGFVWDPVIQQFVAWDGRIGCGGGCPLGPDPGSVYVLAPPAGDWRTEDWIWSKVDPAPGNTVVPSAPNQTGTYSKFLYMPTFNAYILVNRTNENVYAYKLRDGAGIPAPPRPANGGGGGGSSGTALGIAGLIGGLLAVPAAAARRRRSLRPERRGNP